MLKGLVEALALEQQVDLDASRVESLEEIAEGIVMIVTVTNGMQVGVDAAPEADGAIGPACQQVEVEMMTMTKTVKTISQGPCGLDEGAHVGVETATAGAMVGAVPG